MVQLLDVDGDGNVSLMEYVDKMELVMDDAEVLKGPENKAKKMINQFLPAGRYMY